MMTCKQATALAATYLDAPLTFKQRIELKIHLCMCKLCARYVKQLLFLKTAIQHIDRPLESTHLSAEAKQRIKENIEKKIIQGEN